MTADLVAAPVIGSIVAVIGWALAGLRWTIRPREAAIVASTITVAVGLVLGLPLLVTAAPVLAAWGSIEIERRRERARERRRRAALPIVVDAMIQRLRSGAVLRTVCATAAPDDPDVHPEIDEVVRPLVETLGRHRPLREAVARFRSESARRGWHDAQLLAATLTALVDRGSPAAPALTRLRLTLTALIEAHGRAAGQAGQAQASAALLAGAPALFAVVLALVDSDVGAFYLHEPLGAACVTVALLLSIGGWRWMNRLVDGAIGPGSAVMGRASKPRRLTIKRPRSSDDRINALALTIDLVAMTVGAGGTPGDAVALVAGQGPDVVREAFADVVELGRNGTVLIDALPLVTQRLGAAYHPLVTALVANEQGGAPMAPLLQQLATEAEQARRQSVDLALARLPVRLLVPLVVCQLPAVIIGAVVPLTVVALRHLRG